MLVKISVCRSRPRRLNCNANNKKCCGLQCTTHLETIFLVDSPSSVNLKHEGNKYIYLLFFTKNGFDKRYSTPFHHTSSEFCYCWIYFQSVPVFVVSSDQFRSVPVCSQSPLQPDSGLFNSLGAGVVKLTV